MHFLHFGLVYAQASSQPLQPLPHIYRLASTLETCVTIMDRVLPRPQFLRSLEGLAVARAQWHMQHVERKRIIRDNIVSLNVRRNGVMSTFVHNCGLKVGHTSADFFSGFERAFDAIYYTSCPDERPHPQIFGRHLGLCLFPSGCLDEGLATQIKGFGQMVGDSSNVKTDPSGRIVAYLYYSRSDVGRGMP